MRCLAAVICACPLVSRTDAKLVCAQFRVLHGAQLSLQQDLLSLGQSLLDKAHGIAHIGSDLIPIAGDLLEESLGVQFRLVVEVLKEHILNGTDLLQPFHQPWLVKELTNLDAVLGILVGIEGGNAGFGGTKGVSTQPFLFILVLQNMVGHQHLSTLIHDNMGGGHASLTQMVQLLQKFGHIQRHTIADNIGNVGVENAGGELVKGKFSVITNNSMAGICAALEPDDNVRSLREQIGDLPLAFVAPVGSDDRFDHS